MNQNKKYTEIMKQLNYKPIGSVLLRLCGVVKSFVCPRGCGKNGDLGSCSECVGK